LGQINKISPRSHDELRAYLTGEIPDFSGEWVTRYSSRGNPYRYWRAAVPFISRDYLESVVYLYPSEAAAEDGKKIGGTGFLLLVPVNEAIGLQLLFVVTNKHIIRNGNMVARVNTTRGSMDIIALDAAKWFEHPDGDDLAICHIDLTKANHRAKALNVEGFITRERIEKYEIGPGDETFAVGRFINREGRQQNRPAVRFGNISQMPEEPIVQEDGFAQESFLVEARSLSGSSGSPVFVYLPSQYIFGLNKGAREKFNIIGINEARAELPLNIGPWLLGVSYCYIRSDEQVYHTDTGKPVDEKWRVKSNSGMMGVIPAWKIVELLESPEVKELIKTGLRKAHQTNQS
jgi:hypothetical protein